MALTVSRIISGGPTGAGRGSLDFASAHGIPHGGWCPTGRKAKDGRVDGEFRFTRRCTGQGDEK